MKEQINLDKNLERAKEDLAVRADFNTVDAFDLFDPLRRGNLDKYDLKDVFSLFGVSADNDELNLLIKKYDTDLDGKWRYSEFVNAILPKKHEYATLVRNRLPFNSSGRYSRLNLFALDTKYLFISVLRAWISCEAHSETIR